MRERRKTTEFFPVNLGSDLPLSDIVFCMIAFSKFQSCDFAVNSVFAFAKPHLALQEQFFDGKS